MIKKILLLACVVTLTACPLDDLRTNNKGQWRIQNNTNQILLFRVPFLPSPEDRYINRGESELLYYYLLPLKGREIPYFEAFYLDNMKDYDFSWVELLTTDKVLIRRWELTDKDEAGKQFFNESSWIREKETKGKRIDMHWTFEINPDDIE